MAITINLRYTGKKGAAQAFAHEMISIERFFSDDNIPEQDKGFIRN